MKRKANISLVLAVYSLLLHAQPALQQPQRLSLLFIGDIMGHDEQIWSAENRETREYNYDDVFRYIKPVISGADLAIGNLEVTLAGPPYKGYPAFSSPSALAAACRDSGIDCLVTANNHSADKGKKGITGTIARLDSLGIPHTGTFISKEARDSLTPLILEKNGFRIALLNYTYGTNGIKVPEPLVVNMLNKDSIASDIAEAKMKNPDLIVLFLHWGVEYDTVPRREQTEMAEFFFSRGADLVIGSHPHVIQKMEWHRADDQSKDRLVAYSL
ncbi:MAG: CapA family protein, partial [Bacteroidales bacterium]|nr:CapA family protein [Bacteroidales bacterium]